MVETLHVEDRVPNAHFFLGIYASMLLILGIVPVNVLLHPLQRIGKVSPPVVGQDRDPARRDRCQTVDDVLDFLTLGTQ